MTEWYFLITPLAALAVLLLFRFAGCGTLLGADEVTFGEAYPDQVKSDGPKGYWRLQEKIGTTAKNEVAGSPDGNYDKVRGRWRNLRLVIRRKQTRSSFELGVTEQPLLVQTDPNSTSVRVQGGFIRIPFHADLNPQKFTLEALAFPEWGLDEPGKFYCVLESSGPLAAEPNGQKKLGYAIYAGPDDPNDPNSPYHWQVWVGTGTEFKRLSHPPNPGTKVVRRSTYLAVTFDGAKAVLFVGFPEVDFDHAKIELNAFPYQPAVSGDLFIGVTDVERSLFAPFPGPNQKLYPFSGRIAEVAVYDNALTEERIISHGVAALEQDLVYPDLVKLDDPEGYWRLMEESGTFADDLTGSRDGTY